MDTDRLEALCEELRQEPLFHLSLHAKELFHSNFLAWFIEAHNQPARHVFGRWVDSDSDATVTRVQRESSQLDLAVELAGLRPFVVENKVFSPPDEDQLDRYAAGTLAGLKDPDLLLLSLGAPGWDEDGHTSPNGLRWRYVSYLDLADALEDAARELDGFDGELVRRYAGYARALHHIGALAGHAEDDEPLDVPEDYAEPLRSIRLYDGVAKLRARSLVRVLEAHTFPRFSDLGGWFDSGFTNSRAVLQAFLPLPGGDLLGWQYQHGQWRLLVITKQHKGKGEAVRKKRHDYVAQRYGHGWFDFSAIPDLIDADVDDIPRMERRGEYNGYNPDFVYRYRKLPELTLSQARILSDHYLHAAAELRTSRREGGDVP